jgi:hypothetical protein
VIGRDFHLELRTMRRIYEPDGTKSYEEVVVQETDRDGYVIVRQVWSGRTFRVLKKQLFPFDEGRVTK